MANLLEKLFHNISSRMIRRVDDLQYFVKSEIDRNRILQAQILVQTYRLGKAFDMIQDAEFQVFSQWGEDGIIQYLISKIQIENKIFIEFGVQDYTEANTRFLLVNNNWSGLVIDCGSENIASIQNSSLYWRYDLIAKEAFVTCDNINSLIEDSGIRGDIGLLSIDVDGNDYWIWNAINSDLISPRIVIIEYNSLFGKELAVTIPYQPDFDRTRAHFSNLYYGASLKALCLLAKKKGYIFIGSNSAGNNAFFVREDVATHFKEANIADGYVESKFREGRDNDGRLSFARGNQRYAVVAGQKVYDVEKDRIIEL